MSIEERLRLALIFFFLIAIIAIEVVVILVWIMEKTGREVRGSQFAKPAVRKIFSIIFLLLAVCFFYAWLIEPYWIEITKKKIDTPKLKEGTKVRIVHLSDIHSKGWGKNERRIPLIVNSFNPDIICLTGDYMNDINALNAVRRMVGELEAKYGIFAVRGNWDAELFPDVEIFKDLPVRMLNGESTKLKIEGGEIYIVGLDVYSESSLEGLLPSKKEKDFVILLHHYPDLIEDIKEEGIDLYLSGHTHGGQVALPFYGAILTFSKYGKKYEKGLHEVGKTILYVNRGIGTETLPLRFFSRPEIAVFDIEGKGE